MMRILLLLLVLLWSVPVDAATWFVRPNGGAYGSENGTDWDNAYDGFTDINWGADVDAGDTICVAGGTYTQSLVPADSGTNSSTQIYIRRAYAAHATCGSSGTGWSAGFDAEVLQDSVNITLGSFDFITISGFTTGSTCGQYLGTCGWRLSRQGDLAGHGVVCPDGSTANDITMEYIHLEGAGLNAALTGEMRGIDCTAVNGGSGPTNMVFSHMKIVEWESTIYFVPCNTCIVEYTEFTAVGCLSPNCGAGGFHPNMIFAWGADNLTYRYNVAWGRLGEGLFWTNDQANVSGARVYGNFFFLIDSVAKCIQIDNTGTTSNFRIYNNTFDGPCFTGTPISGEPGSYSDCIIQNNIVRHTSTNYPAACTKTTNLQTTNTGVFVDQPNENFHIVSTVSAGFPKNAGTDGSAVLTTDIDGQTFGSDGTWDIGADEQGEGGGTPITHRLRFADLGPATLWLIGLGFLLRRRTMTRIALLLILIVTPTASAQSATIAIFAGTATNPNTSVPITPPTVYGAPVCDQPGFTEVLPVTNPTEGIWDDPIRPGRTCRVSVTTQMAAIPVGSGYKGALKLGTAPYEPFTSAFALAAAQAHPCDTTPTSPTVVNTNQGFTLGWCHDSRDINGNLITITGWELRRNTVGVPGVTITVGATTNAAGFRLYTLPRTETVTGTVTFDVMAVSAAGGGARHTLPSLTVQAPPPPPAVPSAPSRGRVTIP